MYQYLSTYCENSIPMELYYDAENHIYKGIFRSIRCDPIFGDSVTEVLELLSDVSRKFYGG